MPWSLTRDEKQSLQSLRKEALEAWITYTDALHVAQDALERYAPKRDAVVAKVEEIGARLREDFNDKSEGWQQGDRGQEVDGFIQEWESLVVEDADEIYIPDGDPLDEVVDQLPEEV